LRHVDQAACRLGEQLRSQARPQDERLAARQRLTPRLRVAFRDGSSSFNVGEVGHRATSQVAAEELMPLGTWYLIV
jgi:hypothetical protein